MDLSIVIVNYNVRPFLENSLVSIGKAIRDLPAEVFVVDNASDDGSVEMVRERFPEVRLIVNKTNRGFAAGNNTAIPQCRGTYVLLLNPDTLVQEDTFRVMIRFLEEHPDVGLAGCKILNPDGTLQLACRRSFPTPTVALARILGLSALFPDSRLFGKYNLTYLDPNESYEVDAVSGSFMCFRRELVDQIGLLDEQFFMYGEDLDWCYRIKQAGRKISYCPETQIIHYKGESARRSEIDEVKLFYEAMRVFVRKHLKQGVFVSGVLAAGIALREWIAFLGKIARPLLATLADLALIDLSLLLGELIWFKTLFRFPGYAYPITMTVPWLIIAATMYSLGVYTTRKFSISRAAGSVVIGYVIISALTFFFKQYGFSRMVVLISGAINLLLLPGWRLAARSLFRSPQLRRKSLFGRRTIIVGTEGSGQEVLRKLRARVADGYDVVGFIDVGRKRIGERIAGVEILGSIDNIGKVIQEQRASEVIFSTDTLSYSDILSVIGRARNKSVNFRLVPTGLEVIIGKTHIDQLDDIPLVEIEYNIDRFPNRMFKRLFDLAGGAILLVTVYPWASARMKSGKPMSRIQSGALLLPKVLNGTASLVGPPLDKDAPSVNGSARSGAYLGKPGLTGLAQINERDGLTAEEIAKYNLYYAKNQSLMLDLEIILKSVLRGEKN